MDKNRSFARSNKINPATEKNGQDPDNNCNCFSSCFCSRWGQQVTLVMKRCAAEFHRLFQVCTCYSGTQRKPKEGEDALRLNQS